MALLAVETGGGDFELAPAGNHLAVCYCVCDLGYHLNNYGNQQRKVRISWELPNELMKDGRPFSVSKRYTLSLSEKAALRSDLESWRGKPFTAEELKGFDVFAILGKSCMLNVIHEPSQDGKKTYANIASVASLPKGMPPIAAPSNEFIKFAIGDNTSMQFDKLPDWLQKMVSFDGFEPQRSELHSQEGHPPADDIPWT